MKLILILFIVLYISSLKAQDTLFLKKNKIIICNITEIGIDEIKYKKIENEEGPVYVIRKSDVYKITFKNGISEFITPDEMDINKEEAILDKNQAIKVAFLSPIFDHIQIAYERKLKMTKNLELKFGFIGFGNENFNSYFKNLQGAYFAGGVKFLTGTDFYINGMKFVHPLKGTYLKPEFCVSVFDYSVEEWRYYGFNSPTYEIISYRASLFALNMILGKQYILGNTLTFDIHIGVGIGASSLKRKTSTSYPYYEYKPTYYWYTLCLSEKFPMTITSGILIGYIF